MPGSGRVLGHRMNYDVSKGIERQGLSDESQIAEKHSRGTVMTSFSRALEVDAV